MKSARPVKSGPDRPPTDGIRCRWRLLPMLAASGAGLLALAAPERSDASSNSISEPDTILYGRIVNRSAPIDEIVTGGTLAWTFRLPGGESRTFVGPISPIEGSPYAYRLNVPHSILVSGLQGDPGSLPLGIDERTYAFGEILVNGSPARVAEGMVDALTLSQTRRALAMRIDLVLEEPATDTDGDGMPDWWERLHGLDPDSAADAHGDLDGDGLGNLREFLAGSSPNEDNRIPRLARVDFHVFALGRSGLPVRVVDTNSPPEQIRITLTTPPEAGSIVLRGPQGGRALVAGDSFTAAEAASGLIEFRRNAPESDPDAAVAPTLAFTVHVADETGAGTTQTATVHVFRPDAVDFPAEGDWAEQADSARAIPGLSGHSDLRHRADLHARHGDAIVWDLLDSRLAERVEAVSRASTAEEYATGGAWQFGPERSLVLLGGEGADTLAGGLEDDILYGGRGADELTGNGGSDRFIVDAHSGADTIVDFDPAEGDRIDLTRAIRGTSSRLDDYVRVSPAGPGSGRLEIVPSGDPASVPGVTVTLSGHDLTEESLVGLVDSGAILVGDLSVTPLLAVESLGDASENDLAPGRFVIRRAGDADAGLTVNFAVSGSATAGVDYRSLGSTVSIAPGVREVVLEIVPYVDGLDEPGEVVRIDLVAGEGYRVASTASSAELTIADLEPMVTLEVVRSDASFSPREPGLLMLNRTGLLDRQIIVQLRWTGSPARAVLDALPEFVELGRGETRRLIELRPKAGASAPAEALPLSVKILENTTYLMGARPQARLAVVPSSSTFEEWLAANHGELSGQDPETVSLSDPDGLGIPLVTRYALGWKPGLRPGSSAILPRVVKRSGRAGLEFILRPGVSGLDVVAETSTDLKSWNGGTPHLRETSDAAGPEMPAGWRRFEATTPDEGSHRYFRVRLRLRTEQP